MPDKKPRPDPWNFGHDHAAAEVAHTTERARPHQARRGAALRSRLSQPGTMPYVIPEAVIGALAIFQGQAHELAQQLAKAQESPILWSGIVHLDAQGVFTRSFQVQFRCVSVSNLGAALITIAPGGEGDPGRAPVEGAGVHQIPIGSAGRFATMGNAITLYGAPNSYADLAVASRWVDGL